MTGFFKKLKETAEKGIEKGTEIGTKGFDVAKESAKKGIDKARDAEEIEDVKTTETSIQQDSAEQVSPPPNHHEDIPMEIPDSKPSTEIDSKGESDEGNVQKQTNLKTSDSASKLLKLRFAKGEISKEEYEEMKKLLE